MSIIQISGIRCYAYHGCLPEEAIIGGEYVVDIRIEAETSNAEKSDDLSQTVDYVDVYSIVKREMSIRSKLIEHAGKRISDSLVKEIPRIETLEVQIHKIAAPVNGDVPEVSVTIRSARK